MANLLISTLYGQDFSDEPFIQGLGLQFHITVMCDQRCKHCYMYNTSSYKEQLENELKKDEIFELLDQFHEFLAKYQCGGMIAITGGDPILSPHFWDVLTHIKKSYPSSIEISILGNSYHITPQVARHLKENNVGIYQISIDGLEETHDYLRKPGSFHDALRALKVIHNAGIMTVVSYTLSKMNEKDFFPLIDFLEKQDYIDVFGFDRLTPMGNASDQTEEMFTAIEYRNFLFEVFKREVLKKTRLFSSRKEKMWRLLFYELGLVDPFDPYTSRIFAGCSAGMGTITVLANGTVYACRRLELPAGKFPQSNFKEIFIHNSLTSKLREIDKYEKCNNCPLRGYCRGCIATKYAVTGNLYAPDPLCWRNLNAI